jgi:hypothetical protein
MFVCCEFSVLSGRGLCVELITRPEDSYRLWCVVVCDLETSRMRRSWSALGRSATAKKKVCIYIYIYIYIYIFQSWSGRPARPRPTTLLPPRSNGKPEAATAVCEPLMMGMRMPETCWAVFKRRTINLRDWCIWLVDLFK